MIVDKEHEKVGNMRTQTRISKLKSTTWMRPAILGAALVTSVGVANAAGIQNTVTAKGTAPGGVVDAVTASSATVTVNVKAAVTGLTVAKVAVITTDANSNSKGDAGDVVTYTYTVENTGTVTLDTVTLVDAHDGAAAVLPKFDSWTTQSGSPAASAGDSNIVMNPGAVAIFKATYTITAADIAAGGSVDNDSGSITVDGDLDNRVTATGDYTESTATVTDPSVTALASVPLNITPDVTVTKAAYVNCGTGGVPAMLADHSAPNCSSAASGTYAAGEVITYIYTVTNSGDAALSSVNITDSHTDASGTANLATSFLALKDDDANNDGISDNSTATASAVTLLYPGDIAYFYGTYTVTQDDVDQLQ